MARQIGGDILVDSFDPGPGADVIALRNGNIALAWGETNYYDLTSGSSIEVYSPNGTFIAIRGGGGPGPAPILNALIPLLNGNFALLFNNFNADAGLQDQILSPVGAPLSSPVTITSNLSVNSPSDATLTNGDIVTTWTASDGVHGAILNADGSIATSDFTIAANATQSQVSALSGGGFVVTWTDSSGALGDSSGTGVAAEFFNSAGTATSAPFLVNTATAGNQENGGVAELANGGFVSTWLDEQTDQFDAQIFNVSGGKVGGVIDVGAAGASAVPPYATALGDGDFVVAWEDPDNAQIHAQVFNPDGTLDGAETTTDGVVTSLAPKGAGDFVLGTSGTSAVRTAGAEIFSTTDDAAHSELVQSQSTGQLDFLDLTGATLTGSALTSAGYWPVVAEGNFGGNGQSVDLVTQLNGEIDILDMEGSQVVGSDLIQGSYWAVKGTGHFPQAGMGFDIDNGNYFGGDPDLVTQNAATGQIDLLGGGGTFLFNGSYDPVVGVGDFLDNGQTQIATQSSAGQIDILSFNGANLASSDLLPGNYWPVKGVADLNNNGFADLITQNSSTGQIDDLILNGHQVTGTLLESTAVPGFNVVGGAQVADQFWHV